LAISVREGEGKIVVRELNLRVPPRGLKEQVIGTSSSSSFRLAVVCLGNKAKGMGGGDFVI
jgi:hypothetical protein